MKSFSAYRFRWKHAATLVAVCAALAVFSGGSYLVQMSLRGQHIPWLSVIAPETLYWLIWSGTGVCIVWICDRLPLLSPERTALRWRTLTIHLTLSLVVPLVSYLILLTLYEGGGILIGASPDAAWKEALHQLYVLYLFAPGVVLGSLTYFVIAAAAYMRIYFEQFQQESSRRAQAESQLAQAELSALKMQLHPHFLFNTFNSISALLQTDAKAADTMLARLGDFLRLTLDNANRDLVRLEEELDFVRRYLEIEQVRFEDRLTVHFAVAPDTKTALVPNFILQPVVENAVRHGIAKRIAPGCISIRAERLHSQLKIEVDNDGADKRPADGHTNGSASGHTGGTGGIGLTNVQARLLQHYGAAATLLTTHLPHGGFRVTLTLPYSAAAHRTPETGSPHHATPDAVTNSTGVTSSLAAELHE